MKVCSSHKILFEKQGYEDLLDYLDERAYSHVFVLTDTNTSRECLPIFIKKMSSKYDFKSIQISAGENHKTIHTCIDVWQKLSMLGADRQSLVINLGGGVVSDLGGFSALTFKRGIDYINIPTTLLAMVDAAIGGKTGIDLQGLKNQIGIIHPPKIILIDTDYLKTLPSRQKQSGISEILKHGLISKAEVWKSLQGKNIMTESNLLSVIRESSTIKYKIVKQDIQEKHLRKSLNFGHTLGHAIETYFLTYDKKVALSHGEAIAIGMVQAAYFSHRLLGLSEKVLREIKTEILKYFDKISFSTEDIKSIISLLKHDKKNSHGNVNFVLLKDLGKAVMDCNVPDDLILESFDFYYAD